MALRDHLDRTQEYLGKLKKTHFLVITPLIAIALLVGVLAAVNDDTDATVKTQDHSAQPRERSTETSKGTDDTTASVATQATKDGSPHDRLAKGPASQAAADRFGEAVEKERGDRSETIEKTPAETQAMIEEKGPQSTEASRTTQGPNTAPTVPGPTAPGAQDPQRPSSPSAQAPSGNPSAPPPGPQGKVPPSGPVLYPLGTPEPWPKGCCAPLTDMGFDSPEGAKGPAIAVKINNDPHADPQTNLHRADLIYELRAEDVSRFIAVFHSRAADVIGPIRSGRTADPPIIKSLGRPMLVFSGGNDGVMALMEARENDGTLIRMLTRNAVGSFFRSTDRVAPHNFYGHRPGWIGARGAETLPPARQTRFGRTAGAKAHSRPQKLSVDIGQTHSWWQWDKKSGMWLRFQNGRAHLDKETNFQIGRTSVILLGTDHPPSPADPRSPEAVSVGRGEAWVLTGRDYVHGNWTRKSASDTWHLTDDNGKPIPLKKGPVYIGLTGVKPIIE